jgi:hypothetical protein
MKRSGIEDQLLMMLEYWREYRTYFDIGQARGISESAAYRNQMVRKHAGQKQSFSVAGLQGRCCKRTGQGFKAHARYLDTRNRNRIVRALKRKTFSGKQSS